MTSRFDSGKIFRWFKEGERQQKEGQVGRQIEDD